jgi:uncharacterized protein (DUF1330 family)
MLIGGYASTGERSQREELKECLGQPPLVVILLEFPTVEDAQAWYQSPAY